MAKQAYRVVLSFIDDIDEDPDTPEIKEAIADMIQVGDFPHGSIKVAEVEYTGPAK